MSILIDSDLDLALKLIGERLRPMETGEPHEVAYDAIVEAMHWYRAAGERAAGEGRMSESIFYYAQFGELYQLSLLAKKDHENRTAHA